MRWIKASDQLPQKAGFYFVKRIDTNKKMVCRYLNCNWSHGSVFRKIPHLIEWLDESVPDMNDKGMTFFAR